MYERVYGSSECERHNESMLSFYPGNKCVNYEASCTWIHGFSLHLTTTNLHYAYVFWLASNWIYYCRWNGPRKSFISIIIYGKPFAMSELYKKLLLLFSLIMCHNRNQQLFTPQHINPNYDFFFCNNFRNNLQEAAYSCSWGTSDWERDWENRHITAITLTIPMCSMEKMREKTNQTWIKSLNVTSSINRTDLYHNI